MHGSSIPCMPSPLCKLAATASGGCFLQQPFLPLLIAPGAPTRPLQAPLGRSAVFPAAHHTGVVPVS
jgi:hypothetical protein